jgi:hypothetical protein
MVDKLLPAKEAANIETVWKNKTVGKSSEFTMTISNFIFEDRYLTFLKEGKPIAKVHMEVTPSLPVLFLGWLALGIPYLWITSVKEYQMIDLSTEIKRAATEVNP